MSRAILTLVCSFMLMGCIITRDLDYSPPDNSAPAVESHSVSPMNRVYLVNLDAPIGGDGGVTSQLTFVATIRDPDVTQDLEALIFLDRVRDVPGSGLQESIEIPPDHDEDPLSRRVEFQIDRARLAAGCHLVELEVSSGFDRFPGLQPIEEQDLGAGVWWIAAFNASDPAVDMTQCVHQ